MMRMIRRIHALGAVAIGAMALSSVVLADGTQDSKLYKETVAQRIATSSNVATTQAPVKALSVVGYTVDKKGNLVDS